MNRRFSAITILLLSFVFCHVQSPAQTLPEPRAPKRFRVTRLEQVLPNARIIARRPFKWLVGAQYGLGLKKGEKLLIVGSNMDPLVVEALVVAADEMGVSTDVIVKNLAPLMHRLGREEKDYERFDPLKYLITPGILSPAVPDWLAPMVDDYDIIVGFLARGATYGKIGRNKRVRSTAMNWTAEQLASPAVSFPDELHELISMKAWKTLIGGRNFHVYDPRGTDITFSIDPTNLERLKNNRGRVTYGEPSLEQPLAHEISVQVDPNLNVKPDARGVIVSHQAGYMPEAIKIYVEGGQITQVEGGGAVGDNIRAALERFKDVQYPGFYPGPGVGWLEEMPLGVNPKLGPEGPIRHRSGMVQLAFGTVRYNLVRDEEPTLPSHHRDIDLFYHVTLEVDGRKLVDKGHLTVLDDPEVTRLAAKYGDPAQVLSEDWIPEFEAESGRIVYPPYENSP